MGAGAGVCVGRRQDATATAAISRLWWCSVGYRNMKSRRPRERSDEVVAGWTAMGAGAGVCVGRRQDATATAA
jgi:hypothetical protein